VTLSDLEKQFGKDVGILVGGVTKLGKIPYSSKEEQQAENLRKMLLAMAQDIRVVHNKTRGPPPQRQDIRIFKR
jgi:GTP pyrophosphokinase